MRRRIEELGCRPEVTASGGQLGGAGHSQGVPLGANSPGGYVRVPPSIPQQGSRLAPQSGISPVVTVPVTGVNNNSGILTSHDHRSHQVFTGGVFASGKIEMHSGIHSLPSYTTSLQSTTPPQANIGVVDGSRNVVTSQGSTSILSGNPQVSAVSQNHPVIHSNASHTSSQVRHRVSSAGVVQSPLNSTMGNANAIAGVTSNQVSGQFQRLKVEDALSYLDQVKLRFGRQPQVYNDFLDIMKEFKSQSIDTPGVIARVSQLFQGHPELIVGFNTFLPPGYKIEVSVSAPGQLTTVVHTPQGIQHHITPTSNQQTPSPNLPLKPASTTPQCPPRSNVTILSQHSGLTFSTTIGTVSPQNNALSILPGLSCSTSDSVSSDIGSLVSSSGTTLPTVSVPLSTANTMNSNNSSSNEAVVGSPQLPSGGAPPLQVFREPIQSPTVPSHHHSILQQPATQPVEFNHAINYVNKIKLRFQEQPDIYKQFLEILHTYQKEQKYIKEGGSIPARTLTEGEVYDKVAKLFENQEDLLQEFSQFLPDATNSTAAQAAVSDFMDQCSRSHAVNNKNLTNDHTAKKAAQKPSGSTISGPVCPVSTSASSSSVTMPPSNTTSLFGSHSLKRSHSGSNHGSLHSQPTKRPKLTYLKDMSAAKAGKLGALSEYAFFDKVRKALRYEETYFNFLRGLTLFNEEIISRSELIQLIHPFLSKFPDLLKWFKEFMGLLDSAIPSNDIIPASVAKQERIGGDLALEIDYTTCKRLGASYCALPKTHFQPRCTGRNTLCKEVLNDTWVSFPSWSEDSTFVTSKKTQFEEYIYRCEDERFELDVVLETNTGTMRVLEGVQKKLQRMTPEEAVRFRLDDCLGGQSPTIHQKSIHRIYGDKASDIIDGLKKNPVVAVPLVLRRLKAKAEEWREAQKGFNKIWRDQNERYYLKSLDHQGITFKQNDIKSMRSKSLLNEIETLYDERHEQVEEGLDVDLGPHIVLPHRDKSLLDDAANLIIHHVRRQTAIHKDDKAKIKQLVRQFIPDLFFHPRMELSDDEKDYEDEDDGDDGASDTSSKEKEPKPSSCITNTPGCSTTLPSSETNGSGSNGSITSVTGSSKRKTRSAKMSGDIDKQLDSKSKDSSFTIGCDESSQSKIECAKSPVLNGDASEAEKTAINSETNEFKTEVKSEPNSPDSQCPQTFHLSCSSLSDEEYRIFVCNNNWYLLLRLHHILCARLLTMYEHSVKIAADEAKDRRERKESAAVALRLKPKNDIPVEDYYPALLDMVKNVLDGNMESTSYEDTLREMYGIHAYQAFTLDKVVNGAVRQLQHIVCDEPPSQCTSAYLLESRKGGTGGPCASAHRRHHLEQAYQKRIEKLLHEENCYKLCTYKRDCLLTVELLDTEADESEDNGNGSVFGGGKENDSCLLPPSGIAACLHPIIPPVVAEAERWSEYVDRYVTSVSPQLTPAMQAQLSRKPVFLPRNLRSWKKITASNNERNSKEPFGGVQPMEVDDNTQCKFSLSTYKMVFVVNSDSYMYKKQALEKARQSHEFVSKTMKKGFSKWHDGWCRRNVCDSDANACSSWFLGESEGLVPNHTKVNRIDRIHKPPYSPFNKYKCDLLNTS